MILIKKLSFGRSSTCITYFLCCWLCSSLALAQVYEWEYIDPNNTSLGKQESSTLTPDGATANFDIITGLFGRDLTKAYLYQASIPRYRVRTTILNDAYLAEADMFNLQGDGLTARGADMSYSNLQAARLAASDLTATNLTNADLTGATFRNATLTDVDFTSAEILGTNFSGTTTSGYTDQQLYQTKSYQDRVLGDIDLSSNDLRGWNFANQQMMNSNFYGTQLSGADFTDAIIYQAEFSSSDLAANQLYQTASYKNGQLNQSEFSRMDLRNWELSNLSLIQFRSTESDFSGATFENSNLTNAYLEGSQSNDHNDVSFRNANLTNATFGSQSGLWKRANFTGANLEGADLRNARFEDTIFVDAIIRGAMLSIDNFSTVGITHSNIYSTASYKNGDLTNIYVRNGDMRGVNLSGIDISGSQFIQTNMDFANFSNVTAIGAQFSDSLDGADFSNADLKDSYFSFGSASAISFRGANLTGATFERTSLMGVDITDAIVYGMRLSVENSPQDLSKEQLYSTASYKSGMLGPITLAGDMRDWDFTGQDISGGARFDRGSNLEGATWQGANIQNALFFVNAMSDTDFRFTDARDVQFSASVLDRSNFRGNDLSGTHFSETSLIEVDFEGANLVDVRFVRTNLENASFKDANLQEAYFFSNESFAGTDFSGANIVGADFSYATDDGFTLQQLASTASYQQKNLAGIVFEGVQFPSIDFSGFNLLGADFNRSTLVGASFRNANLTSAEFIFADIEYVDFTDASIRDANFSSAVREGFTQEMLESTASYKNYDLYSVNFSSNDLRDWDFSCQDLRLARFENSDLTGANFELADLRGATLPDDLSEIDFQRTIMPDSTMTLMLIGSGEKLRIHNSPSDSSSSVSGIMVGNGLIDPAGRLELIFNDDEWNSTIVFNAKSNAFLYGTLDLSFEDIDLAKYSVGDIFDLFDWPTEKEFGAEFEIETNPRLIWDLSNLYTTGEIQLVDVLPVPEPASVLLVLMGASCLCSSRSQNLR